MADKTSPRELPGNHGQFGRNIATEDYKPLEDQEGEGRTFPPAPAKTEGDKPCS